MLLFCAKITIIAIEDGIRIAQKTESIRELKECVRKEIFTVLADVPKFLVSTFV